MVASWSLSASGCFLSSSTRPTQILSHDFRSMPFTSVPDMWRRCARSSTGTVTSTYSRSHDPAIAATGVALRILAVTDHAREGDLGRRLGEREVVRPESHIAPAAE